MRRLRIIFLEPFYGGSHRDFADGLSKHSRHDIELVVMPDRFWKWRMRGAALHFYRKVRSPAEYALCFCSDMMSVADLKALWGDQSPPIVLYMHENQLSYPLPQGKRIDYHFGFTNLTSALVSDCVVFNSHFHFNSFVSRLPEFLSHLPEYRPNWTAEIIEGKSRVLYPGCEVPSFADEAKNDDSGPTNPATPQLDRRDRIPLIVWNHRWEFDKDPALFFRVIERLDHNGYDFRIALLGESFQSMPKEFERAKTTIGDRILRYGYEPSKQRYREWLNRGWVVVSTAIQENFGISVVEAVRAGCFPLLPYRLSYPEILPESYHERCLYDDEDDLYKRMVSIISAKSPPDTGELSRAMSAYDWDNTIDSYDRLFEEIAL